jgi:hypothetical protein
MAKFDLLQGALAFMVLKTLDTMGRSTATASHGASSSSGEISSPSITRRCTPPPQTRTTGLRHVGVGRLRQQSEREALGT